MIRRNTFTIAAVAVASTFVATTATAKTPTRFPADRPIDIKHIKLNLEVSLEEKTVDAVATIELTALRDAASVRFDAVDFDVSTVEAGQNERNLSLANFVNDGEHIVVSFSGDGLPKGETRFVRIKYKLVDPASGLHFFGPSEAEPDMPYVVWSQGQSIYNRYWVPCFDHPNEMQTTETIVTVDDRFEVVSNGKLLSKNPTLDGRVTYHWLQDQPHVAYLITLIVGEFHLVEEEWRGKPVRYYVPPDRAADIDRSFSKTKPMLDFFSERLGVEYPWAQYAQTAAPEFGGGMENTSATTLGENTLHDERAHLDFSSDGLVAHELMHQWFGDMLTCKDWSHLWLNEGWATYGSALWLEHEKGRHEYDYSIWRYMQRALRGGRERPVVDRNYDTPGQMFDARSYPKGASILHMLRRKIGDDEFWQATREYLKRFRHQPVETSDMRGVYEELTGQALERFFYDWTARPGAPQVRATYSWDEERNLAEIEIEQTQDADAFEFPLVVEFRFDDGAPVELRQTVRKKTHRMVVPFPQRPAMVLVDPHLDALLELTESKGRHLWEKQLREDPHVVGRIRAAEHFGKSGKPRDAKLLGEAVLTEPFWGVGEQIAAALGECGGDEARDALLECLNVEDPYIRRACTEELGTFHKDENVIAALTRVVKTGDPSYRVEAAAIEALGEVQPEGATSLLAEAMTRDSHRERIRSAALRAMGSLGDKTAIETLIEWSKRGKPRYCRAAAVQGLAKLAERTRLTGDETQRIVDAIANVIPGENRRLQRTAIGALRTMGEAAEPALPTLRAIAANDPESRIREAAERAAEQIASGAPPNVQTDDLRQQLESLQYETEQMRKRLEKLDALSDIQDAERVPG